MSSVTFRCKKSKFVIWAILTELKENTQLICTGELNNRYVIKTIAKLKDCVFCASLYSMCILRQFVFCTIVYFVQS